ncbi:viral A-type inclusion protein [Clostridium taeniosporum]|uniref:Viral A-type inclusion protein n=1 Tax=Clostridium taeniosporum TaxID=394958 RepID=A0A1D7XJE7_9CLOT|nr:viral A-type inclusion protein [Clostridium taeniosporum]AOR23464.1 viral A-type inclusion protein [Clostridium taeniosporum]
MDKKSLLVQCDEVTKNMMDELQQDMIESLSKISKNINDELEEILKPIEKKINILKDEVGEGNEDIEEKIEEINEHMLKISKCVEVISEEHSKLLNSGLNRIAVTLEKLKDRIEDSDKELETKVLEGLDSLGNKIEDVNIESLEDKLAILGVKVVKSSEINKEEIINKIQEINVDEAKEKVSSLEEAIKVNINNSCEAMEKLDSVHEKMLEKYEIMNMINDMETKLNKKMNNIQEEVEWGNKSFFARIFGKRR